MIWLMAGFGILAIIAGLVAWRSGATGGSPLALVLCLVFALIAVMLGAATAAKTDRGAGAHRSPMVNVRGNIVEPGMRTTIIDLSRAQNGFKIEGNRWGLPAE